MKEKKSVTKALRVRYQRSRKKERQVVLDEFCFLTGYNRSYAARVLRGKEHKRAKPTKKRTREKIYDQEVLVSLRKIWAILDGICGKRLVAILPQIIPRLERFGEIKLSDETREKLGKISASAIDRLLRLYTNFFLPSAKLIKKTRIGSKVAKKYDDPKTPHQRLLNSKHITQETRSRLNEQYELLNPAQLKRTINKLQDNLYKIHKIKRELNEKEAIKTSSLEYILDESTNSHLEYIIK